MCQEIKDICWISLFAIIFSPLLMLIDSYDVAPWHCVDENNKHVGLIPMKNNICGFNWALVSGFSLSSSSKQFRLHVGNNDFTQAKDLVASHSSSIDFLETDWSLNTPYDLVVQANASPRMFKLIEDHVLLHEQYIKSAYEGKHVDSLLRLHKSEWWKDNKGKTCPDATCTEREKHAFNLALIAAAGTEAQDTVLAHANSFWTKKFYPIDVSWEDPATGTWGLTNPDTAISVAILRNGFDKLAVLLGHSSFKAKDNKNKLQQGLNSHFTLFKLGHSISDEKDKSYDQIAREQASAYKQKYPELNRLLTAHGAELEL